MPSACRTSSGSRVQGFRGSEVRVHGFGFKRFGFKRFGFKRFGFKRFEGSQ
jgi:hypothetical protein